MTAAAVTLGSSRSPQIGTGGNMILLHAAGDELPLGEVVHVARYQIRQCRCCGREFWSRWWPAKCGKCRYRLVDKARPFADSDRECLPYRALGRDAEYVRALKGTGMRWS